LRATELDIESLDAAIGDAAPNAFAFLERLVASPSVVGDEAPAQAIVAEELERLGFDVEEISIPEDIDDDPAAGVPQTSYEGRRNVVGRSSGSGGRSLLLNGHVDVVPPSEPELWTSPPFAPTRRDGWLLGRGAGDMKGGFAMAFLAIDGLVRADPTALSGQLAFASVIEEECTGNGTLAAGRAGVVADAVVLPEPTELSLLLAGVGILWLDVTVEGRAAHAQSADRTTNPVDAAIPVIAALRDFEREMNADVVDPVFDGVDHPYNVNIGRLRAGDWPSSVPALARIGVRIGHPTAWTTDEAERRVRDAIATAADANGWLAEHPPTLRRAGFRAQGYAIARDDPLVEALADAHASVLGSRPALVAMGSTTDARYYLNQFGIPAVCYGPRARNIHGVDEAVELSSIVDGARSLARFMARWFADEPEP